MAGRRSTLLTHAAWIKRKITLVRAVALRRKQIQGLKGLLTAGAIGSPA